MGPKATSKTSTNAAKQVYLRLRADGYTDQSILAMASAQVASAHRDLMTGIGTPGELDQVLTDLEIGALDDRGE